MFLLADVNFISPIRTAISMLNLLYSEFSCIGSINICNTFNGESVWKVAITWQTFVVLFMRLFRMSPHYFMMRSGIESILGTKEVFFMCGRTKIWRAVCCAWTSKLTKCTPNATLKRIGNLLSYSGRPWSSHILDKLNFRHCVLHLELVNLF
jgi:hypothetical protein